ncbi:MAG TPA: hypothetical protein VFE65_10875 [Pseudonocardia sp.]|jgi:hypothetical protein|nr:hypothetical protein [Pseudonocardia sp.]
MTRAAAPTPLDEQERQVQAQLRDLEARLVKEYGDRNEVLEVLSALRDQFEGARIRTFLPILIERAARMELGTAT